MGHETEINRIRREFAERLNLALDELNFPAKGTGRQTLLARKLGRSQKGVRRWLEGEGLPRPKDIERLAQLCNIRKEWLLFGLGPMQISPDNDEQANKILLQRIIVTMGVALQQHKIPANEQQKAQLISTLYEALRS